MCVPYTWQYDRRFSLGTTYQFSNILDIGAPNTSNENILVGMELFQADRSALPPNCQTTEITQSTKLELTQTNLSCWVKEKVEKSGVSWKEISHVTHNLSAPSATETRKWWWACMNLSGSAWLHRTLVIVKQNPHVRTWEDGWRRWGVGWGVLEGWERVPLDLSVLLPV